MNKEVADTSIELTCQMWYFSHRYFLSWLGKYRTLQIFVVINYWWTRSSNKSILTRNDLLDMFCIVSFPNTFLSAPLAVFLSRNLDRDGKEGQNGIFTFVSVFPGQAIKKVQRFH